jgi:geranylgeranyl pyrophosphate synthase
MLKELFDSIPKEILSSSQQLNLNIESKNCHQAINSLLQRTVLLGGKRLRPLLTLLMGPFFGAENSKCLPYAKAIEMVHAASLAHDDVIDLATQRRGAPSINIDASNKRAVLAGDFLLADVIVSLSETGNLELVKQMSYVIQDLALGEWIQADAKENRNYTREIIENIALKKTASVMSWCCYAAAIDQKLPENIIQYAKELGSHLGLAFQLMDDSLDFSGASKKDYQLDLKNGMLNSVVYEWLELNPDKMNAFKSGEDIYVLVGDNNLSEAVSIIQKNAHVHLRKCKEILILLQQELPLSITSLTSHKNSIKPLNLIIDYMGGRKF